MGSIESNLSQSADITLYCGILAVICIYAFFIRSISPAKKLAITLSFGVIVLGLALKSAYQMYSGHFASVSGIAVWTTLILMIALTTYSLLDGRAVGNWIGKHVARVNPATMATNAMIDRLDLVSLGNNAEDQENQKIWERNHKSEVDRRSLRERMDEGTGTTREIQDKILAEQEDFNQKDNEYKRRYKKAKDDAERDAERVSITKAKIIAQYLEETVGQGIGGDID